MTNTPILLILYNRPDTTAEVLEALRPLRPTRLFVAADAPARPEDAARCTQALQIIERVDWDCTITLWAADHHMGLKRRVESALDMLFEQAEQAVILEDDCVPDVTFFAYCDDLLTRYADDPRVMGIAGSNFHFGSYHPPASYHFSRYALIWGWATWRRAWRLNDPQMTAFPALRRTSWLTDQLRLGLVARYWEAQFARCYEEQHTWDYAWMFACWLHSGLFAVPAHNLVRNVGFRADAAHTKDASSRFANMPTQALTFPLRHPPQVERDETADDLTERLAFSGVSVDDMLAAARAALRRGSS
jgi:hypothetical protein